MFFILDLNSYLCGRNKVIVRGNKANGNDKENIRCFHEVAADAAMYFDPLSTDSMTDALEKSLTDSALLSSLMKKGYERMKAFTWSETARKYELVYKTLI